jgi:HK97 family phage portal protein
VYGAYEILHIPGLSFDGLVGLSPIQYAAQAIGLALATERFGAQFFGNGAAPTLALEHPGTVKDPKRLRENFRAAYGGRNNRGVAVLEEGMKVSVISVPPESAQFLETRKFQLTEICRIYRVPPHLVQHLENATFSNIEHQSIDYVQHTLVPWMVRWEQAVDARLLTEQERADGLYVKLNANALVRGDFKSRMDGYAIGRQNGFLSTNDIRRLEDMDIVPEPDGGDALLVNGNMITLKTAMEAKPANTKGGTTNDGTGADEPQPAEPAAGEADAGDDAGVPGGG